MKKVASLMVGLLLCGCTAFANEAVPAPQKAAATVVAADHVPVTQVFDYVYDPGVFTSINEELGKASLAKGFGGGAGKCTAIAKTLPNGDTVMGRNLDFYITHNPAYIIRTKGIKGLYDTIGITYEHKTYPNNEYVKEKGIPKQIRELLPFSSTDVLNEKGFFMEVNMRFDEPGKDGKPLFASSGTNPKSKDRVSVIMLPRYIASRCATVDEAVALAKKLDIYSIQAPGMNWSLCMQIADATGNYGLLEIAQNKISFLKKQPVQTNFYVTKAWNKKQHFQSGLGRYETVMNGLKDVKTEEDMFNLTKKVSYYQCNFPDICQYDPRTELVMDNSKWSTGYILDPKNQEEVKAKLEEGAAQLRSMTREQIMDDGNYWESVLTLVVNCNKKTMKVRFFEDDNKVMTLGFDK